MRRAMLVLPLLSVPVLLLAQHHTGSEGSSGSSGSSASGVSSGYSGGSASYNSSGSSHSSSSGSGPSSSSSSSGHSGAGGASNGSGSYAHGGSSSSTASYGRSGSHFDVLKSSSAAHSGTPDMTGSPFHDLTPQVTPELLSAGITRDALQQPIHLREPDSSDVKKALAPGEFDSELKELGLLRSKSDYQAKMASVATTSPSQRQEQSWFSKLVWGRGPDPDLRPCRLKECRPIPQPPRPRPPIPPNAPPTADNVCLSGAPTPNGTECSPWGYVQDCHQQYGCRIYLRPVTVSYCDAILTRLNQKADQVSVLEQTRKAACSANRAGFECAAATGDYQSELQTLQQLKRQYQLCRMSVGEDPNVAGNWNTALP